MFPNKNLRSAIKTVAAAGTAEALLSSSLLVSNCKIKALKNNTDNVYVGDSTVLSTSGFELVAGEEIDLCCLLPEGATIDLAEIFVDVITNGDGVSFIYVE